MAHCMVLDANGIYVNDKQSPTEHKAECELGIPPESIKAFKLKIPVLYHFVNILRN